MGEQANPNWERLQEIEALTGRLIASQKNLFEAQVILSDRQDRAEKLLISFAELAQGTEMRLQKLTGAVEQIAEAQKHSDARLDALIAVVDDLARKNGGRGNAPLQ